MLRRIDEILLIIGVCAAFFAAGCGLPTKTSAVSENESNSGTTVSQTTNSAVSNAASPSAATPANDQAAAANNVKKTSLAEFAPRKVDKNTAESPVYAFNSKNCERQATDDFVYKCKAYGEYILSGGGYDGINNYSIEPKNADAGFFVDLMPLAEGDAAKYLRNAQFIQKLGDKIT